MKRVAVAAAVIVALVVALVLAIVWWLREDATPAANRPAAGEVAGKPRRATEAQRRVDPATLARASIEGTVRDETSAPVAGARVCAVGWSHELADELLHHDPCTLTGAHGEYQLANLLPAKYVVSASAKPFRPANHHPGGSPEETQLRLAAGQQLTGADITLRAGGVELTGVVFDLTGGPIEKARVSVRGNRRSGSSARAITETDADGTFSVWVATGSASVSASAEGYADEWEWTRAPGKVEILLTPESTLAGIVVDAASGEPVAGARVSVGGSEWGGGSGTFSDAAGAFRVARLTPGRYVATARTERGYGRSEGSTLVGLGQTVEGVVVELHPAVRLEGKVVIASTKQPCEDTRVSLVDRAKSRWASVRSEDGRVWAEGVLPGKYNVDVECDGYQARERYEPVVVADKDITELVWEVDPGAAIEGRVLDKTGAPIDDARVTASTTGGEARRRGDWSSDRSAGGGVFRLDGLAPGTYKLDVSSDRGIAPVDGYKVEVAAGATVKQDLVLEAAGTIRGVVVDAEGAPVPNIEVTARPLARAWGRFSGDDNKTDETGAFTLDNVRAGDYRVIARRSWNSSLRKPGTTDDAEQGERVTVRANQTATVRIVVEAQTGVITGTVTDAATGAPVADAFISAARESDAAGAARAGGASETRWTWDERPVLTTTDGTFMLTKLSPGKYTVRAYRKGGGEAIAEHVAIGGTAKLEIKPTGSISGTVTTGAGPPDEVSISLRDLVTGYSRRETFFRTGGTFTVPDLPKGKFQLTAIAEGGQAQLDIELAEGETRKGVAIELGELVTLTGRVVEHGTNKPVAAIRMMARPALGGGRSSYTSPEDRANITDADGRFTIVDAPRGKLMIRGVPRDFRDSEHAFLNAVRQVDGTGTVDLGDLTIFRNRIKPNEPAGKHGLRFKESAPGTPPDARELEVSWIDPAGPAAKTELEVGDVITSIDGVDVTGANVLQAFVLMRAAPGTKLALGLARGATVHLVLAPP